jgi:predicted O-methyltransferase YrrM
MTAPLVSCLLPTYNRRAFIVHAIAYYLRQTHKNCELIILDDGEDPINDLVPDHSTIRYERLSAKVTLGAKLNIGCEMARGEVIAHFDDDDWYAPWRLTYQIEALTRTGADVCGINQLLYYDLRDGRAYDYRYPGGQRVWLLGSDLVYRRGYWRKRQFADINVGMDGLFCWSAAPDRIVALEEREFAVHMIHGTNISPKQVNSLYWSPHDVDDIVRVLGADWTYYGPSGHGATALPMPREPDMTGINGAVHPRDVLKPLRNVYACLVHERPDCVIDLVSNLRRMDAHSRILLYDGSERGDLLENRLPWDRWGVELCPAPHTMRWGRLHPFALDCFAYARGGAHFDVMTIVDSDQLALRPGYCEFLARRLPQRGSLGVLSPVPARQGPESRIAPCVTAHQEIELWRPFLRRFEDGEEKFAYWSFWPSTVIGREAGLAILDLLEGDGQLQAILEASRLWATEEVLFPTLAALLGFDILRTPCADDYNKYRVAFAAHDIEAALRRTDAFFIHPVPRIYADPARARLRAAYEEYRLAPAPLAATPPFLVTPVLRRMRAIEGWLEDEEAELLARVAQDCLVQPSSPKRIVEIGSFCGKATFVLASVVNAFGPDARILAVDRFDGVVGALGREERKGPTLEKFKRMLTETKLASIVDIVIGGAGEAACDEPIGLLLVDGLHDYASVVADFHAFADRLAPGARVAFHDYSDYFPGVRRFVDELVASGGYQVVSHAQSLIVLACQDG